VAAVGGTVSCDPSVRIFMELACCEAGELKRAL
jgi:hypothetical protein